MRPAVFLDRDGVLNRALVRDGRPYPPASLEEMELLPGAKAACAALRSAGYLLVMVTNQPDIARRTQTVEAVSQMNRWLQQELELDDIQVCPHDDTDQCACRKPSPGMLLDAASLWDVDLRQSFMVGDRWRDMEAGKRAGCRTVLIDYGYREKCAPAPDHVTSSLLGASEWILRGAGIGTEII